MTNLSPVIYAALQEKTEFKRPQARAPYTAAGCVLRLQRGTGREALLEAVVRAVAREGAGGFSTRQVASKAGLTQGLVHYYFGSRESMLEEAYKWAMDKGIQNMALSPTKEWVSDWIAQLTTISDADAELHIFINEVVLDACRRPDLRPKVIPLFEQIFAVLDGALRVSNVRATPARARILFSIIVGISLQHLVFRSPKLVRESGAEIARIIEGWHEG